MIRDILDNKAFRILFGMFIGIPSTLAFLIVLPSGLIMGVTGIRDFDVPTLSMGIASIFGAFGVMGAWLRLTKEIDQFSQNQITYLRLLLSGGITATVILLALTIWAGTFLVFGLPMIALLVVGVCFYAGT